MKYSNSSTKNISLSLESIILDYPLQQSGPDLFTKKLLSIASAGRIMHEKKGDYIRALDNISITLNSGDNLAIIGGNGAGKTTLLKVISGVFYPTDGKILSEGHIVSLLGTGFGLDEDATGYENILLGGITLGFTKKEITEKIPEIEEFTELGEFLSLPLRTYSAGMRARLAFAISTAIYPDILVIDEGLSTGDQSFFSKAESRLSKLLTNSKILIFASHDESLLKKFCNKSIVMNQGKIKFSGSVEEGLNYYHNSLISSV